MAGPFQLNLTPFIEAQKNPERHKRSGSGNNRFDAYKMKVYPEDKP